MELIGTSIYIEKARYAGLKKAAALLNISETELFSILLHKSRSVFGEKAVIKRTVKYQNTCDKNDYLIAHVVFYDTDYEFATSRRYIFKISVSYIIRIAIDIFLDKIIYEMTHFRKEADLARRLFLVE